MSLHAFLCACFTDHGDTRFVFDLARLHFAMLQGNQGNQVSILSYCNPTQDTWEYIHAAWRVLSRHLTESEMGEFNLLESPSSLRDPTHLLADLKKLNGLTTNDRVFIYLTDHGDDLGFSLNEHTCVEAGQLQEVLLHILEQGASVLLLVAACSSNRLVRAFATNHLKGTAHKRCTIILDDGSFAGGSSYNVTLVAAKQMMGTEFCHVLLILLDRLKTQGNRDPSLREFHMQFPSKFIAFFGANGDENLSSFFGPNISNYSSELTKLPSDRLSFVSITGFNSNQPSLRFLVSPKLMLLITILLGHPPSDEELSIEFDDADEAKYYPLVVEICRLLKKRRFIIPGSFPAPRAVNCLVTIPIATISRTVDTVEEQTSLLSSNIK